MKKKIKILRIKRKKIMFKIIKIEIKKIFNLFIHFNFNEDFYSLYIIIILI